MQIADGINVNSCPTLNTVSTTLTRYHSLGYRSHKMKQLCLSQLTSIERLKSFFRFATYTMEIGCARYGKFPYSWRDFFHYIFLIPTRHTLLQSHLARENKVNEALVNREECKKKIEWKKSIRNFRFEKRMNSIAANNVSEMLRKKGRGDKRPIECDNIEVIEFRPPKNALRTGFANTSRAGSDCRFCPRIYMLKIWMVFHPPIFARKSLYFVIPVTKPERAGWNETIYGEKKIEIAFLECYCSGLVPRFHPTKSSRSITTVNAVNSSTI